MKAPLLAALLFLATASPGLADFDASDGGGAAMPDGTIQVTGYLPTGQRTASGLWPYPGSAACPEEWPFGQRVHISGKLELTLTCTDRYARWLSPRIDVYTRYYREATALTGVYSFWLLP